MHDLSLDGWGLCRNFSGGPLDILIDFMDNRLAHIDVHGLLYIGINRRENIRFRFQGCVFFCLYEISEFLVNVFLFFYKRPRS